MSLEVVAELPAIDADFLERARLAAGDLAEHERLCGEAGIFKQVEVRQPAGAVAHHHGPVRIGTWNAERCKYVGASVRLIRDSGCDVVLLSEMDVGMSRSANLHTLRALAGELGFGYAYCVEFLELGSGNQSEQVEYADEPNLAGLHGNGILSRFPLSDPLIVTSPAQGSWYSLDWHHRRLGGRRALFATVDTGPARIRVGSVHLESLSDSGTRAKELSALIEPADSMLPTVIGGDFNTTDVPDEHAPDAWFADPGRHEPLFDVFASAGFDWLDCNSPVPTRRTLGNGLPRPPHRRMDWLFRRGLVARDPRCWPAVNSAGHPISDHDLVSADMLPA
ncbi:endonuclease/exonuclease/phosphatase family protein [Actinoplanes sp. NPDC026670]|uniref:endonuclease/exonuclease/phosphatase family protein n=1 Tax=Actinoplanes sp. NPDC026670 TaxID=3154700 RepID=UPI0034022BCD